MPITPISTDTILEYRIPEGGHVIFTDHTGQKIMDIDEADGQVEFPSGGLNVGGDDVVLLPDLGASTGELDVLDGATITTDEINLLDGITGPPVQTVERTFTETTGAGTYTATVAIPAGATVLDVIWRNTAVWTATTSATFTCGDGDDADGYYTSTDLKTAPVADTNGAGAGLSTRLSLGASAGAYKGGGGKYYAAAGTITATVTTVGAAGNAGRSRLLVEYALPSSAAATKA